MARIEARLQKLPVEPLGLDAYEGVVPDHQLDRACRLAAEVRGMRILFEMGRAGRRSATEGFAVTRLLGDELEMLGARRAVPA